MRPLLLLAVLLLLRPPTADAGMHVAFLGSLDSGSYRGDGSGSGFGIELGFWRENGLGGIVTLHAMSSTRGDSDPIFLTSLDLRVRRSLDSSTESVGPFLSIGLGVGTAHYPLAQLDAAAVSVPLELGVEGPAGPRAHWGLALQERPFLTIGDGDPAFSFVNRLGALASLRW